MSLEEDTNAFRIWATNLGCPQDAIPSEEALKSILKSRQRELFCNMMKRMQPRQVVQEVRENLLVHELEKIKDQLVPVNTRQFLPKEMQTYLKVTDLKKKEKDIEARLEDCKRDYETLAASIKTKNMQCIHMQHKFDALRAKVDILELKSKSLDNEIVKEQENQKRLKAAMPVKLTSKNANVLTASKAVEAALKELEIFYNAYDKTTSPSNLQALKDELWQKMRTIFANVPNFLLFNIIMRLKDEQLQNITAMNKNGHDQAHTPSYISNTKEKLSPFHVKLLKTKADFLGLVAKTIATRNERMRLEERFSAAYGPFVDELQRKVQLLNGPNDDCDAIISEYIVQFNSWNFSKSENEFLAQEIEKLKVEIENDAKQLEDHEVLLGSIKQTYSDVNASILRVQYDMMQLGQIKEKIIYSKNMLKHLLYDVESSSNNNSGTTQQSFVPIQLKINDISLMSTDSFELCSSDNVFCSTKLDLENTITPMHNRTMSRGFNAAANTTLMSSGGQNAEGRLTLPPHLTELNTFAGIQMDKFSCISKECGFYISPNPLIIEATELSSTLKLAPGILLTPYGAIEEVRQRVLWADLIAAHSKDLKLNLDLIFVDANAYKQQMKQHRDQIDELLDKIQVTGVNTNHTLQRLAKFYDFMLENPLRHFIPTTKLYQNQTYCDYENAYTMYYMIANGKTTV